MEQIATIVTVVSGVCAVLSFFIPINTPRARIWHAAYILVVSGVVAYATYQGSRLARVNDVSRAADQLVKARATDFTDRGYALAALAFLEKNRDLFPDSYARATRACENFKCEDPGSSVDMVDLAFTFDGIVKGIGTLSSSK